MTSREENDRALRSQPQGSLESPFFWEELFARDSEAECEAHLGVLEAESPFRRAFEEGISTIDEERQDEDDYAANELSSFEFEGGSPLDVLSPSELKAVRITSTFETGRAGSFGGLTGNFDGQGVSFGLMNFAWKAGSLVTLLKEFLRDHPAAFAEVFGPDTDRFREIVLATKPDPKNPKLQVRDVDRQMEFARNVLNDANNKIREPWRTYFRRLETNPEFRRIQVKAVRKAAERARYWCEYFGLKTERAFAFMFDLVSSHGGAWLNAKKFKGQRRKRLRAMIEKKKADVGRVELTELDKLEVIANMIADVSGEKWRDKVRIRKLWFVNGNGRVHGEFWDLAKDFGVTDATPDFGGNQALQQETELAESSYEWAREEPEDLVQCPDEARSSSAFGQALEEHPPELFEADEGQFWPEDTAAKEEYVWSHERAPQLEEAEGEEEAAEDTEASLAHPGERQEEEYGEFENHLDDSEKEDYGEIELDGELSEEAASEAPLDVAHAAQILIQKAMTGRTPAEVALTIHRWGRAENTKISGARLKLYECDIGEAGRTDAATAQNVQIAEFSLDLAPNPEFVKNPSKPGIPRVSATKAKWANPTLEKGYKATRSADFILKLGKNAFPLWIPRQDILEEGNAVEIGFALEDGKGNKVERMSIVHGHVVSLPIPNHLKQMLEIPGRFDDPKRDPTVEMDGTKFDVFLKGRNRREFIAKWLEEHPALKEAANEPDADLKTSDIIKAWFVIHDVGAKASLTDKRFKASQPKTKRGAVHGFLNRASYYTATHDFTKNRQGTVYEFLSKRGREIANGRTINIETVPDVESFLRDTAGGSHGEPSNADLYASIGYKPAKKNGVKGVTYYKWTKTAFDVLADLYIFASVRAGHLLTITVHKEMDRNLGQSVIWREYSAAEIRSAKKDSFLGKARDKPHNYHGDPYGFDVQALYDLITLKLNALGGKQMPVGARYGIHPRRVCKADGENIPNGSHHLHEFPHQSDPVVKKDTGLKKSGWWNV